MALPSNAWRRVHQYAKIAQESNLAPRKRSQPNGAPEQSGVLGLLWRNGSHNAATCIQQNPYPRQVSECECEYEAAVFTLYGIALATGAKAIPYGVNTALLWAFFG